jgi:hypothetical protein
MSYGVLERFESATKMMTARRTITASADGAQTSSMLRPPASGPRSLILRKDQSRSFAPKRVIRVVDRSDRRASRGAIHLRSRLIIAHAERDRAQASGPVLELVIAKSHPRCRRRDTHYLIRATRARRREHPRARCLHLLPSYCYLDCRCQPQRHSYLSRVQ